MPRAARRIASEQRAVSACYRIAMTATPFDELWERAHAAHPELGVDRDELCEFVADRLGDGDPHVELPQRHAGDLLLACACARGNTAALAALEEDVLPAVERGIATFAERDELLQMLREQMLVARDGKLGIAAYDGRAPLAVWLRVCATRLGLRRDQRERREVDLDDHELEQLAPGVPDPELAYLKRIYGEQFRAAFAEAVTQLAARERTLLRLSVLDGLGIDQIAAIFHIHRATAARQLKQAREHLVAATRECMRANLRVSDSELDSIMRMITGLADLTLQHVLGRRGDSRN
jgi:RNA polymerase sigma-70 factor (ECF subfamily)